MTLPTLMLKGKLRSPLENEAELDPSFAEELRESIPIDYIMNWFKTRLYKTGMENRVLILKSETASGKSTSLPPKLYRTFVHGKNSPGVLCSQPRVLTAIANVHEMLLWNSDIMRLGENTGWSTQYNKVKPKIAGMLSATIGTVAQILKVMTDDEIAAKFKYILIDETHERDLQTDITIYMLKNLLRRMSNKTDCPFVVLMSATFDPTPLLEYFKIPRLTNFIWCAGATAKIDEMWDYVTEIKAPDYIAAAAQTVEHICREGKNDTPNKGDILIFLPGGGEMSKVAALLAPINAKMVKEELGVFSVLKLDSTAVNTYNADMKKLIDIALEDQIVKIDGTAYVPIRRVIMSTNVAETGLTLDGLKYVIDAGYNRETEYNPVYGTTTLLTKPAPKSRIRQRRGRSGRKFPGVFYPLYSYEIHEKLQLIQYPQILTSDISVIMMDIIKEQLKVKKQNGEPAVFRIKDIDMIDVPTPDALTDAMERLHTLGLISVDAPVITELTELTDATEESTTPIPRSFCLTRLGILALATGQPPEIARMILAGYAWGVAIVDLLAIAVYLQLEGEKGISGPSREWQEANPKKIAPGINWMTIYRASIGESVYDSASHPEDPDLMYKVKLLLSDNFIDGICLMNAILRVSVNTNLMESLNYLRQWCADNFIQYDKAIRMITKRDELIEMLLIEGFDIYRGHRLDGSQDLIDYVTRVKHCIYDGFRCNVLRLVDGQYMARGIPVSTPSLFRDDERKLKTSAKYEKSGVFDIKPTTMIYQSLELKLNKKTNMFNAITRIVSVLDGYIEPDEF